MTDAEMLERAVAFNAGPMVHSNGWIFDPNDPPELQPSDFAHHHYEITLRGENAWAITSRGKTVLSKDGEWEYEPFPSERTEDFLDRTRWATAREAFEFLEKWRPKELERALAQGFKYWRDKSK